MESKTPERDVRKEIRFAVVMYGGVSLAIYINGVVQELFEMVRATATSPDATPLVPGNELSGSGRVYRRLGQMLEREGEEQDELLHEDSPIRTKFVVDILCGSSAGGINAVYLAKALANGQEIDQLSQLWIDQGDIWKLINDEESVKDLGGLKEQKPPSSLLNGQRMYLKLLEALDGMEAKENRASPPYVEKLDLFVTATDYYGLPVPLRLADKVVEELRHRNVYHLRYGELAGKIHNDFLARNNPFLAFAARSTSAFPFAFEPMKLAGMDDVFETATAYQHLRGIGRNRELWQAFFPAYRWLGSGSHARERDFTDRAFVDGGYLDNKPFSYAMDALASRDSRVPVDRKLVYIEPSPEHLEDRGGDGKVPNAIENVAAALSSLPRYEPIREDLQRVLYRNRLVERVKTITSRMEEDVRAGDPAQTRGVAYGGYHRLRVDAVSDDIVKMIAHAAEFDAGSDEFFATRYLVRAWRRRNYADGPAETKFLARYDLAYHIRRLNFVLSKINRHRRLRTETEGLLRQDGLDVPATEEEKEAFRKGLADLRTGMNAILVDLQRIRQELEMFGSKNPLTDAVRATKLTRDKLIELLETPVDVREEEAARVVSGSEEAFGILASVLGNHIAEATRLGAGCQEILDSPGPDEGPQRFETAASKFVRHYYDSYDHYDLISFPILYGTEVGEETDPVDVVRVSPEDAPSLIDERAAHEHRRKLAGTAIRGFGAFFEHDWRRNDILWGRLDGAERIITMLLPGPPRKGQRDKYLWEAQLEILADELKGQDQFSRLLVEAMPKKASVEPSEASLRKLAEDVRSGNPLEGRALLSYFGEKYEVDKQMNRETKLRTLARSSRVAGRMLEDILGGAGHLVTVWLARLGAAFRGVVEASVPGSLRNLSFRRRLVLLYIFEAVLIAAGFFVSSGVALFGLVALIATAAVHAGTLALGDYMRRKRRWRWWLAPIVGFVAIIAVAIVLFVVLGIYHLPEIR